MPLDSELDFQEDCKSLLKKVNKTVALVHKFQNILLRAHLDYGGIIYAKAFNNFFHQKSESLQHHAALSITGFIEKLCIKKCPKYLFDIIPLSNFQYKTRNAHITLHFNTKHKLKIRIFHQR